MTLIFNKIILSMSVSTDQLTIILLITGGILLFFIALAVIKMYKLKAENKKLIENQSFKSEVEEGYKDFTGGHLYGDDK